MGEGDEGKQADGKAGREEGAGEQADGWQAEQGGGGAGRRRAGRRERLRGKGTDTEGSVSVRGHPDCGRWSGKEVRRTRPVGSVADSARGGARGEASGCREVSERWHESGRARAGRS